MPDMARSGQWVQVHRTLLDPGSRAPRVPPETQAVPLEMWVKGFLVDGPAAPGDQVVVETAIGRRVTGRLVDVNPAYTHGFGESVPELLTIGSSLRGIIAAASGQPETDAAPDDQAPKQEEAQ